MSFASLPQVHNGQAIRAEFFNELIRSGQALERDLATLKRSLSTARSAYPTPVGPVPQPDPVGVVLLSQTQALAFADLLAELGITVPQPAEGAEVEDFCYALYATQFAVLVGTNGGTVTLPAQSATWALSRVDFGSTYTLTRTSQMPQGQAGLYVAFGGTAAGIIRGTQALVEGTPSGSGDFGLITAAPVGTVYTTAETEDSLPNALYVPHYLPLF